MPKQNERITTVGELMVELAKFDELSPVRLLVAAGCLDGVRRLRALDGRVVIEATPTGRFGR